MEENFYSFIINKRSTLKDALIQMTSTHKGMLLVVDEDFNLLGILADGDVRRALINDVSLIIPVEQVMNLNPVVCNSINDAKEKLKKSPHLLMIPIVNESGRLVSLFTNIRGENHYKADVQVTSKISTENKIAKIKNLAIIPARGGSKRIPRKNLKSVGHHSLLGLAITTARSSDYIDYICVSTDDIKISEEAEKYGVLVPWLRPKELSMDDSKTIDVMLHAIDMFHKANNYFPELIVLLEPTAPLRSPKIINDAFNTFNESNADSLVSVNEIRHNFHPEELLISKDDMYLEPFLSERTFDNRKLRNEQEKVYVQNGLIYITRTEILLNKKSIYGDRVLKYETIPSLFCDIDSEDDLLLANHKIKNI